MERQKKGNNILDASNGNDIFYLDASEEEIKEVRKFNYKKIHNDRTWRENVEIIMPELLQGSDYSGGTLHRSNYLKFLEDFGETDGVYDIYGSYGSYGIAILTSINDKKIRDTLLALHTYPVIDDEYLSELEMNLQEDSWSNWVRKEFVDLLEKEFNIEFLEFNNDEDLHNLFDRLCKHSNVQWEAQSGSEMYIAINKLKLNIIEMEHINDIYVFKINDITATAKD